MNKNVEDPQVRDPRSPTDRLDSWKEIAAYLKCSVRTVRRWEDEGLPVHRHAHRKKPGIYAYKAEIDVWWRNGHEHSTQIGDAQEQPSTVFRWRGPWLAAGLVLTGLLVILATVTVFEKHQKTLDSAPAPRIQSLAVLPLENLSLDPEQEYFADGMTDTLITDLAQIGSLKVISRTSSMRYKLTRKSLPQIAQELDVDGIVEGTVQRSGDRVRITAQLIHGPSDKHLWAHSYEGEVRDILTIQSEVARSIAKQIEIQLTPSQHSRLTSAPPINRDAYELYLKGRFFWNKRTEAGLRKGIEYFQKAIDQDPNYALAHAGLADSYIVLANWGFASPAECYPKAKAAALKALEIDPRLAEAHTSLAYVTLLYEWNWTESEREFRQALAINPNYVSAHHFYSICLMSAGRHTEAQSEIKRAQELDPVSLIVGDVSGWIYYEGRQYDRAIAQYKRTLEIDPDYVPALIDLGISYLRIGDYHDALAQFEKARLLEGDKVRVLSAMARAYALSGQRVPAVRILERLRKAAKQEFIPPWELSLVYTALGDNKQAIEMLRKAADDHVGWVVLLGVEPALDSLRKQTEFQKLTKRIGSPSADQL
jgi:TolB-like protein/Tfp pilus assembly protein PilF